MKKQPPNFDRRVHCLLGLPFDALDMTNALQFVQSAVTERQRYFFSTPNLNFLISCLCDAPFRDSVIHSDMSLADGMPLLWLARLLRIPLPERVAGSCLFESLRDDVDNKLKVYFFGGPSGVAEAACRSLNKAPCGIECVGFATPGFGSIEEMSSNETIKRINASGADFLVVALGAKKGNAWIEQNLARLEVPVVSHLGAVVNFVAGSVSRAPVWLQRIGLEWLWRIKEEPQLWRRYFFDGLAFIRLLISRVFPYAWYMRRHPPLLHEVARASVSVDTQADIAVLKLQGVWTLNNLDPLRAAFKLAVVDAVDIKLDMTDVNHVDSAFVGLLMLLFGHQQLIGKQLNVVSAANVVCRIFRWNCAEFLLEQSRNEIA